MGDSKSVDESILYRNYLEFTPEVVSNEMNESNTYDNGQNCSSSTERSSKYSASDSGPSTDVSMEVNDCSNNSLQIKTFNPQLGCCSTRFNPNMYKGCKWYLTIIRLTKLAVFRI